MAKLGPKLRHTTLAENINICCLDEYQDEVLDVQSVDSGRRKGSSPPPDQINMAVCFWDLIKSDLFSVG